MFGTVFDCNVFFSGSVRTSFNTHRHNTEQVTYDMIDIQCVQQTVLQTPARTYSRDQLMVLRLATLTADLYVRRSVDDLGVRRHDPNSVFVLTGDLNRLNTTAIIVWS